MRCQICHLEEAFQDNDYCSKECAQYGIIAENLKKLHGVLIEIKHSIERLER